LARIKELGSGKLAIFNGKHTGGNLIFKIAGNPRDSESGACLIKSARSRIWRRLALSAASDELIASIDILFVSSRRCDD
jgi:hypothetical protein